MIIFEGNGVFDDKNEYNLFYGEYNSQHFFTKQFFQKNQCIQNKLQKISFEGMTVFEGKEKLP